MIRNEETNSTIRSAHRANKRAPTCSSFSGGFFNVSWGERDPPKAIKQTRQHNDPGPLPRLAAGCFNSPLQTFSGVFLSRFVMLFNGFDFIKVFQVRGLQMIFKTAGFLLNLVIWSFF